MITDHLWLTALCLVTTTIAAVRIDNAEPYDKADSKSYAIYSGLAYCPKKCLESWTCEGGKDLKRFGEVSYINNLVTLASCYIGYESQRNLIILSFRGSDNIQNWIENFNFEKTSYSCKGCQIHAGFLSDYRLIEEKINNKVSDLLVKHPTASIISTGHSLGGALSEIAGLRLKAQFNKKTVVHNFGCPRVGNAAMAQYIATRVDTLYRVVHNRDIVPHLPPEPLEYHHSPFEVFWNQQMTSYQICNQSGEDQTCSDKFFPDYLISDHHFYFVQLDSLKC